MPSSCCLQVLVGLRPGMPMTLDESSLTEDPAAATTTNAHDLTLPKLKYSFNLMLVSDYSGNSPLL